MTGAPGKDYAVPVLPSLSLPESRDFFETLGFASFYDDDGFLGMSRGPLELHFWPCEDRGICEASGCYFQVVDVETYYRDWSPGLPVKPRLDAGEEDHARVSGPPEDKPWGMREFALWDPHGNLFRVGQKSNAV